MIILNNIQAKIITITVGSNQIIPLKISDNVYIINETIEKFPEISKKIDFSKLEKFTIGDGSKYDLMYQNYINSKNNEVI